MNVKSILALLMALMFLLTSTHVATAVSGPNRGQGLGVMDKEVEEEDVEEVEVEEIEVEEIELEEMDVLKII